MKKCLFPVIILLVFTSCYEKERNCANFKEGRFVFEAMVGTTLETTVFERSETIEIDYFRGKADTSVIRWINDCEYIIKKKNPKNRAEEKSIHIKILETKGNQYTFEYSEVGAAKKQIGTAVKQ